MNEYQFPRIGRLGPDSWSVSVSWIAQHLELAAFLMHD